MKRIALPSKNLKVLFVKRTPFVLKKIMYLLQANWKNFRHFECLTMSFRLQYYSWGKQPDSPRHRRLGGMLKFL